MPLPSLKCLTPDEVGIVTLAGPGTVSLSFLLVRSPSSFAGYIVIGSPPFLLQSLQSNFRESSEKLSSATWSSIVKDFGSKLTVVRLASARPCLTQKLARCYLRPGIFHSTSFLFFLFFCSSSRTLPQPLRETSENLGVLRPTLDHVLSRIRSQSLSNTPETSCCCSEKFVTHQLKNSVDFPLQSSNIVNFTLKWLTKTGPPKLTSRSDKFLAK